MEGNHFHLHWLPYSEVNYRKDSVCNMFSKKIILSAWKFKECFGLKQAFDCYYKLVMKKLTNLLMIITSEWTKLKYTLNLVRCFLLHSTKFQYFFMDSKVICQIHMITDMFNNIWKEYFIKECFWSERNILRVRFYCLAVSGVWLSYA